MLDRDWIFDFCFKWIFSAITLMILSQLLLAPNLASFNCVRAEPSRFQCELSSSGLFGTYKTEISSEQIRSIKIDSECHYPKHSSKKCNHSIIIRTTNGKIPLSYNPYSEKSDAQITKGSIDTFIRDRKQKSLTIEKDDRGIVPVATIVLVSSILTLVILLNPMQIAIIICIISPFLILALDLSNLKNSPIASINLPFSILFSILSIISILRTFVFASPSNEFGADNNSSPEENID
jgi:hypothetical protein